MSIYSWFKNRNLRLTCGKQIKQQFTITFILIFIISLVFTGFGPTKNVQATLVPTLDWMKTYGGQNDDVARSIIQTMDGGYAIAGYTESYGIGGRDVLLVKTDTNGDQLWNQTYGGSHDEEAISIIQTMDGGYALAGYSRSFTHETVGIMDFWLVKTDSNGNKEWNISYGGGDSDTASSVIETADGGFAVGGYTNSYGAGGYDFWLVRSDADGWPIWTQTYGFASDEYITAMIQTTDGGFALFGHTTSIGRGENDFWLVKTDANGDFMWSRVYGGTEDERAWSITQTNDGGFMLLGSTSSKYGNGEKDFWLVKTDSNGAAQWNKLYGGPNYDNGRSIVEVADGGFVLVGYTDSYGAGRSDAWLIMIKADGNIEWAQTYGGQENDIVFSAISTFDDSIAFTGWSSSYGETGSDFWIVKTTSVLTTVASHIKTPITTTGLIISSPIIIKSPIPLITQSINPIITKPVVKPVTISITSESIITPATTTVPTSKTSIETIPEMNFTTTQKAIPDTVTITVTKEEDEMGVIPGYTSLSVLFGMTVAIFVFKKRRK